MPDFFLYTEGNSIVVGRVDVFFLLSASLVLTKTRDAQSRKIATRPFCYRGLSSPDERRDYTFSRVPCHAVEGTVAATCAETRDSRFLHCKFLNRQLFVFVAA